MSIPKQRLEYIDELLLACGWVRSEKGWLAPEHFRELLAQELGSGHVKRSVAMAAQVQFDEACAAEETLKMVSHQAVAKRGGPGNDREIAASQVHSLVNT